MARQMVVHGITRVDGYLVCFSKTFLLRHQEVSIAYPAADWELP